MESNFTKLAAIDVSAKIEKKQNLSYLSWAWAVDQLLRNDSGATWSYGDPVRWGETVMVFCTVEAFGKKMTAQLPVMDHRNKAIPNPDAFQVNTAMQRCLVKAIALHGLGLYIYAGEDIPPSEDEPEIQSASGASVKQGAYARLPIEVREYLDRAARNIDGSMPDVPKALTYVKSAIEDWPEEDEAELKKALWHLLGSKTRTAIDKAQKGQPVPA